MGAVLTRFKKKQTTVEVLEGLDKEIQSLEQFKRHNEELQRRYVGGLLIYSIVLYIAAAVMFYFLFFPEGWQERVIRSLPLLMFPLLIWTVKKLLHWYFVRRITKKESQLEDLREKKKNILEDVMEHETYKAAKEILERFGPSKEEPTPEQTPPGSPRRQPGPPIPTPGPPPPGQELRQRRTPAPPAQPNIPRLAVAPTRVETPSQGTPALPRPPGHSLPQATPSMVSPRTPSRGPPEWHAGTPWPAGVPSRPPGPPLARPILPRERTVFDRVVDYLVGEGPSSRFALICQQCHSHNGMALQEEFEFINRPFQQQVPKQDSQYFEVLWEVDIITTTGVEVTTSACPWKEWSGTTQWPVISTRATCTGLSTRSVLGTSPQTTWSPSPTLVTTTSPARCVSCPVGLHTS